HLVRRARRNARCAGGRARSNRGRRILFEAAPRRSRRNGARSRDLGGRKKSSPPACFRHMKRIVVIIAGLTLANGALAEKIALTGGTVINPADGKILSNTTIVIDGERIISIGQNAPNESRKIDCAGKFILPGYIDTHVHFFQSGDLFTRPDGADLNSVRPYRDEVGWIKSHLADTFARYLRCGITSVVDVGGPMWNFEVRKTADSTAKAPLLAW